MLFFFPTCFCCESTATATPSGTLGDCPECPLGAPERWSVTMGAGIVADGVGCTDAECATLEGTFILKHLSGCTWITDEDGPLCDGIVPDPAYQLSHNGVVWRLTANADGLLAQWTLPLADFDCLGDNTLANLQDFAGGCTGWPASMVVSPA